MANLLQSELLQIGDLRADDPQFEAKWARRLSAALSAVTGQGPHADLQKGIAALNLTRIAMRAHPALETEGRSLDWLLMELLNAAIGAPAVLKVTTFTRRPGDSVMRLDDRMVTHITAAAVETLLKAGGVTKINDAVTLVISCFTDAGVTGPNGGLLKKTTVVGWHNRCTIGDGSGMDEYDRGHMQDFLTQRPVSSGEDAVIRVRELAEMALQAQA